MGLQSPILRFDFSPGAEATRKLWSLRGRPVFLSGDRYLEGQCRLGGPIHHRVMTKILRNAIAYTAHLVFAAMLVIPAMLFDTILASRPQRASDEA